MFYYICPSSPLDTDFRGPTSKGGEGSGEESSGAEGRGGKGKEGEGTTCSPVTLPSTTS